jgi:hypothetical protein
MPSDLTNRGIMGIGFGQGSYGTAYNALLQLKDVANGDMQPGYIVRLGNTTPEITVGLTPENTHGFGLIPLSASSLYPGQWDPNSFEGCVSFSTGGNSAVFNQCANMLFDTGTINFTLKTHVASEPMTIMNNPPDINSGTTVTVSVPNTAPVISYNYSSTAAPKGATWANKQSSVSWLDREDGVYFLIGQYVFTHYDYLFDPTAGWIGFKPVAQ